MSKENILHHTDCSDSGAGLEEDGNCAYCALTAAEERIEERHKRVVELEAEADELRRELRVLRDSVRVQAAIAAMQEIIARYNGTFPGTAFDAVRYADALIAELRKEVAK